MAQTIVVTAEKLRRQAGELRRLNSQFQSSVNDLVAREGTLNNQWEGDANTAFHNAFTKDKGQMEEFYKLIEQYCRALEEIAREYDTAERKNTEIASNRTYH